MEADATRLEVIATSNKKLLVYFYMYKNGVEVDRGSSMVDARHGPQMSSLQPAAGALLYSLWHGSREFVLIVKA